MLRPIRTLLPALVLLPALAQAALAQFPPTSGREWYEETVQHGFRFKPPKDWKFFPAEFGKANGLGRYVPDRATSYTADEPGRFGPAMWILVFDDDHRAPKARRDATARENTQAAFTNYHLDLAAWLRANLGELRAEAPLSHLEEVEREEVKLKGFEGAFEVLYHAQERAEDPRYVLNVWATVVELTERKRMALVANAPSDRKDWSKWRRGLRKIARTTARAEIEEVDTSDVEGGGLRARRHRELLEEVQANPGWELYVTDDYFVISNSEDRDFVKEVQRRLEAIREQFEKEFPLEKAVRAAEVRRQHAVAAASGASEEGDPEATPPGEDADAARTVPLNLDDPIELSRCSVVRVCNDRGDYHKYGGPRGSAGYWWSLSEELVLYDDKAVGGRRRTWETLNHEAFHQFIYYYLGNLAPGIWFNEGNADFYAGYELTRRGRYETGRRGSRYMTVREEIREEWVVPLPTLVRATQPEYYGRAPLGDKGLRSRYPQGWSFVYFLRTADKNRAKGWDKEWAPILDTYLDALIETRDVEKATDLAFAGVDWPAMEKAWKAYIE